VLIRGLSECVATAICRGWTVHWQGFVKFCFVYKSGRCGLCWFSCGIQEGKHIVIDKGLWAERKRAVNQVKVRPWVQAIQGAPLLENDQASSQVPPIIVSRA